MEWKIKNITLKNQVVLAPMAGISNPSYMKICEEMGVAYAITELISAEALARNNQKTYEMLTGLDTLTIPVAVQLFASNIDSMVKAAQILVDNYHIQIIDINMGCPVPKVAIHAQAGSALLKDVNKIYHMVSALVNNVNVPITVKIRSGWDNNTINAVEVAKTIEKAGASAITIHGRTRSQGYTGKVDYSIIKQVKQAVNIPVIGNGDIVDIQSATKMLATGVDAIMVGRGALGNPWLIKELVTYLDKGIELDKPSNEEKINMCFKHLDYLLKIKKEPTAILEMRSHIAWYLKGLPDSIDVKNKVFKAKTKEELTTILNNYLLELKS